MKRPDIYTKKQLEHSMSEHLKHILQREWENVKPGGYLEANFNLVYIFCMCGCTYTMGLSGEREEEAKELN